MNEYNEKRTNLQSWLLLRPCTLANAQSRLIASDTCSTGASTSMFAEGPRAVLLRELVLCSSGPPPRALVPGHTLEGPKQTWASSVGTESCVERPATSVESRNDRTVSLTERVPRAVESDGAGRSDRRFFKKLVDSRQMGGLACRTLLTDNQDFLWARQLARRLTSKLAQTLRVQDGVEKFMPVAMSHEMVGRRWVLEIPGSTKVYQLQTAARISHHIAPRKVGVDHTKMMELMDGFLEFVKSIM